MPQRLFLHFPFSSPAEGHCSDAEPCVCAALVSGARSEDVHQWRPEAAAEDSSASQGAPQDLQRKRAYTHMHTHSWGASTLNIAVCLLETNFQIGHINPKFIEKHYCKYRQ